MAKNLILRTQANEILENIRKRGLDPSEFQWKEVKSRATPNLLVSGLFHGPTGHYFIFDFFRSVEYYTVRSPGPGSGFDLGYPKTWGEQYANVLEWLDWLKREVEAPDLWAAISQERKLAEVASASAASNTPFTVDEQRQVSGRLDEIAQYLIKTQTLSEQHTDFVKKRLDYLKEATKRLGRLDWLHTAIAVFVTIVMETGIGSNAARELFRFAGQILGQLLGGIASLP